MGNISIFKSSINDEVVDTVDARQLHKALGVGRDFSTWIKSRLKSYGFEQDSDYVIFDDLSSPNGGSAKARKQRTIEYYLTIDMAKHIGMMERNEQGFAIRKYFIEHEKATREITNTLIVQFNKALSDYEKYSDLASNAGRALCVVGKRLKPESLERVNAIKEKLQPSLFVE